MEEPPGDPDLWSHEPWIDWLNLTRLSPGDDQTIRRGPRSRGAGPMVLGAGMLGLQQAIFGPVDEPDVVVIADADGHDDRDDMKLNFVPGDPKGNFSRRARSLAERPDAPVQVIARRRGQGIQPQRRGSR